MNQPGVIRRTDRASELFADFEALSRAATRDHYQTHMRLDVGRVRFIDTHEVMQDGREAVAAAAAVDRLFAGGVNALRPVLVDARALTHADEPASGSTLPPAGWASTGSSCGAATCWARASSRTTAP